MAKIRVKILKQGVAGKRTVRPGDVVELELEEANQVIRAGRGKKTDEKPSEAGSPFKAKEEKKVNGSK